MTALLALHDLACRRGGRLLFQGLNLELAAGEWLLVQGANGAGKTSLLRMLCGLLAPARGEVCWRGQRIDRLREEFGRELCYLGHAAALKDELSAVENLQVAAGLAGRQVVERDALAALAAAGLRGRERAPVRMLSQGQRRRAALARLLLTPAAALWVLDEPFNALDSVATSWLRTLTAAQLAAGGIVVLTSHLPVTLDAAPAPRMLTL